MKVLIVGWLNLPHSYSMVLYNLLKELVNYKDLKIYFHEAEVFDGWKKSLIGIQYNFEIYKGQPVDLIFRLAFPYVIENTEIPQLIFYTSETGKFVKEHFHGNLNKKHLYFTTPSEWSRQALQFNNKIINHGIDPEIFYMDEMEKKIGREKFQIKEDETIFLNLGAMTGNKGINKILGALKNYKGKYKLILKGLKDIYKSKEYLENTLKECNFLETENIIFIDQTLKMDQIRLLYNISDYYISPYTSEGFNLCPLEAMACGCSLVISGKGASNTYLDKILKNIKTDCIQLIEGDIVNSEREKFFLTSDQKVLNAINNCGKDLNQRKEISEFVRKNYDWKIFSKELYNYFEWIINNN